MNIEKAELLAKQFFAFQFKTKKVTFSARHGYHESKKTGNRGSFLQFRKFEPYDSLQAIDWRKSAKSDEFIVQDKEWETEHTIWLWRSRSPTMSYHSGLVQVGKKELAELVILSLAAIFRNGGERISYLGSKLPAKNGQLGFENFIQAMSSNKDKGAIPVTKSLSKSSRVILVSDFINPSTSFEKQARQLAQQGCKGSLIQILDPAEETFPFQGRIKFESIEGRDSQLLQRAEEIRIDYMNGLAEHRNYLNKIAKDIGWEFFNFSTETKAEVILKLVLYRLINQNRLAK